MSEVDNIDFSKVIQSSKSTLRVSIDEQKTMLKFKGATPSFLSGITQYNYTEIIAELAKPTWTPAD